MSIVFARIELMSLTRIVNIINFFADLNESDSVTCNARGTCALLMRFYNRYKRKANKLVAK